MTVARTAEQIVELLELQPHPEGGFYRETWIGPMVGGRASGTSIYYLLPESESSRWHRIDAAEIWHHYAGAALVLSTWTDGRAVEQCVLGSDLASGDRPQLVVPPDEWQSARSSARGRSSAARSRPASSSIASSSHRPSGDRRPEHRSGGLEHHRVAWQLLALLETTPASTRAMPPSSSDGGPGRGRSSRSARGHRQQGEEHGEAAHRDAPQHVLVDAVADGVGEHPDQQAGDQQARRRPTRRRCPGAPNGVRTTAPIARPTPRPDTPRSSWATRDRDDVGRPAAPTRRGATAARACCRRARRRRARPRRRRRDRGRRRCGGARVITAATTIGPMNSIATALPRSVRSIAM